MSRLPLFFAPLLLGLPLACDRRVPEPQPGASTATAVKTATAPATAAASAPLAPVTGRFVYPDAERIVAIGDLHGDLDVTRKALRLAGAIDEKDRWVGGSLVVVQTGDLIDRGDDDRAVLDLLERLRVEAAKAGGAMHLLLGNHELMNVQFDFRYVTPASFTSFADQRPATAAGPTLAGRGAARLESLTPTEKGRGFAFAPGGPYARLLAPRQTVIRVGKTAFVHGGILPEHVAYGIDRLNDEVSAWMLGQRPEPPPVAVSEEGAVWTRAFSNESRSPDCARLGRSLAALGAERMVVGHTPQRAGITSACDGKVWRIDTGLSHHYGGPLQVLEIDKSGPHARKPGDPPAPPLPAVSASASASAAPSAPRPAPAPSR